MRPLFHLQRDLFRWSLAASAGGLLIASILLPWIFQRAFFLPALERLPLALIAATYALQIAGFGLLLSALPRPFDRSRAEGHAVPAARPLAPSHLSLWLKTLCIGAAASLGLWLSPVHSESPRIFLALWLVFSAQSAAVLAVNALLLRVTGDRDRIARQGTVAVLALAMTAIFWSREMIHHASKSALTEGRSLSARLTDAVMTYSPPMAQASTWYHESAAARDTERVTAERLDLIRGPLTYNVWIGSYQTAAYPSLWPDRSSNSPDAGLVLPLLIFGLAGILASDLWAAFRPRRRSEPSAADAAPLTSS